VVSYSFRIYFDFYGYSLIAIGLGRFFGFHLPINFDRPYAAPNPRIFWRRWHVTLSYWIRDYVYLSLGGNRRYVLNILTIFALCGLWHGAAWRFIIWGLFHAGLVVGYSSISSSWDRLPRIIQIALNFSLVSLGWTLFVFSFGDTAVFFRSLLGQGSGEMGARTVEMWAVLGVAAVTCFGVNIEEIVCRPRESLTSRVGYSVVLGGLALGTILFTGTSETFIYFRF